MSALSKAWKRLEKALGKDAKRLSLRPPAPAAKITAAEKKLGFALPPELREWLQMYDGQKSGDNVLSVLATGGGFLPLKDIVDTWKMQETTPIPRRPKRSRRTKAASAGS